MTNGQATLIAVNSRSWQGGCLGIDAAETRTGGVATRVDDLGAWVAAKAAEIRVTDFNCDAAEDVAVGDPKAFVAGLSEAGLSEAGLVKVVHGAGKGSEPLHQDLSSYVPGGAEADDEFGGVPAVVD